MRVVVMDDRCRGCFIYETVYGETPRDLKHGIKCAFELENPYGYCPCHECLVKPMCSRQCDEMRIY